MKEILSEVRNDSHPVPKIGFVPMLEATFQMTVLSVGVGSWPDALIIRSRIFNRTWISLKT